jgi:hypothetical protein
MLQKTGATLKNFGKKTPNQIILEQSQFRTKSEND